jgi:hypothetical protein
MAAAALRLRVMSSWADELNPGAPDPSSIAISKHNLAPLEDVGIKVDDGMLYFLPSLAEPRRASPSIPTSSQRS